ncbi:uncharacterized protein GGS22DRAFT_160086 [Annulohypoxylon maeteangense]|uniref:uncharacterized protein n=1 Tax=Annulohypoxylon maeteangense TaxID=1927788 RepID=UPI002007FA03|nr:uncharacterized protein GGS22DRAFT_160086 [Annulohypoxylon maeteangense]KAI0886164.1 hypothetical protein GGS22DRAFT_160086 [Annulohypoxylon maeteangense]
MFSVDFSLRRFSVSTLLWSWLLFRSRCDDVSTDGGTSELGVVGVPGIEVETVTLTTTIAYNPDHTGRDTTDTNDDGTQSGDAEEPTPTSTDTEASLSLPTAASQASTDGSNKPTKASMSSSSPTPSTSISDTPGTLPSSAIGAIVGSISGAIILSAAIFLCFRAYKRKKQREEARESMELDKPQEDRKWHPRRLIPSTIDTTGLHRPRDFDGNDRNAARHAHGGNDANIGLATDGSDMVPTTPALEAGGRPHTGLHSRRISTASPSTSRRDSLYNKLLDEVKAGPAQPQLSTPTAASSAVEWRDSHTPSTSPAGAFNFDFNRNNRKPSSGPGFMVTNPTPVARPEGTLGDRAWHRGKMFPLFQPPKTGPPSMPLPPTPPPRTQRSIDSVILSLASGSTSRPKQQSVGNRSGDAKGGLGLTESTEALILPQSMYKLEEPANISTIALGPSPGPTPPPKDDPFTLPTDGLFTLPEGDLFTLPNTRYEGPKNEGDVKGKGKDMKPSERQKTRSPTESPTLPLISQDGQSDVAPWSSMMHAAGVGDQGMASKEKGKGEKQEHEQGQEQGKPKRRDSCSTVGTSILFPSEDES